MQFNFLLELIDVGTPEARETQIQPGQNYFRSVKT